jgi:hypothetical protein
MPRKVILGFGISLDGYIARRNGAMDYLTIEEEGEALMADFFVSAATIYSASLNGLNEVGPNASPGTGSGTFTLNGDLLTVNLSFTGLTTPDVAGHIHCCGPIGMNEPVAVPFSGFPTGTSGTYNQTFDLTLVSTYDPTFLTSEGGTAGLAEAGLIAALNTGQTYANIHTTLFPGGEIRGQIQGAVPEPTTAGLCLLGLVSSIGLIRRKRSKPKAAGGLG